MENKPLLTAAFLSMLLLTAVAVIQTVNLAWANPFLYHEWGSPPYGTNPPAILISSPNNNSLHAADSVTFAFNVSIRESKNTGYPQAVPMLTEVYYEADWQEGNTSVYRVDMSTPYYEHIADISHNKTLTGIPDGNHNITIVSAAEGAYGVGLTSYYFSIGNTASVFFTIDTTPPTIAVLSPENKTYTTSRLLLNFTVNEAVSQINYSLDGTENVTTAGNITLTDLPNGDHNITIYATDEAGNVGISETISFSVAVPEPFPTAPVAAVSGASAFIVGAGLLVYFKKRKH